MAFDFPNRTEGFVHDIASGTLIQRDVDTDAIEYAEKDAEINATRRALVGYGAINACQGEAQLLPERDSTASIYSHSSASVSLYDRREDRKKAATNAQDRLVGELLFGDGQ
jgi:hypothetical protein